MWCVCCQLFNGRIAVNRVGHFGIQYVVLTENKEEHPCQGLWHLVIIKAFSLRLILFRWSNLVLVYLLTCRRHVQCTIGRTLTVTLLFS